MWRWLHSLPRAVRQHFHGPGASAGIQVEEHHEVIEKESLCRRKYHCRQNKRNNKEGNDRQQSSEPDSKEYLRSVERQQAFVDAVSLGGVVALGIDICRNKCLQKTYHRLEETVKERFFPSAAVHVLPKPHSPSTGSVLVGTSLCLPSVKAEQETKERREETNAFDPFEHVNVFEVSKPPNATEKKESSKITKAKNQGEVESVEDAFEQFKVICDKYTAVGKGIMGSLEAQKHNYKQAAELWEESSQLGHAKSRFNLALCYEMGKGVKKDMKEAVRLYKLAAEDLHPQAMYNLGRIYLEGSLDIPVDVQKGLELISLAADFGLSEAQCYLGIYYTCGAQEDEKRAVHYLTLSANQKNAEAEYSLALCYQHGYGVDENLCKAASLFHKAADQGHSDALYSLAVFYREGIGGLPRNVEYSQELMKQAADGGCQEAIDEIQKQIIDADTANDKNKVHCIHGCVSSPCLTDLLRQNMATLNSSVICDPVSNNGTISQLCSQLNDPCGFIMKPSVANVLGSNPGYGFNGELNTVTKEFNIKRATENFTSTDNPRRNQLDRRDKGAKSQHLREMNYRDLRGDENFDPTLSCSALQRRTSTMPDLSIIPCI